MADKKLTALTRVTNPARTDLLYIVVDPAGTPLERAIEAGDLFTKHNNQYTGHGLNGTVAASTTMYLPLGYWGINALAYNIPILRAGTVKNLYYRHNTAQPASGSLVITVNKNNVNTALQITITSATPAPSTQTDLVNSFAVVAGDLVVIELKNNATGATGQVGFCSFEIEFDTE